MRFSSTLAPRESGDPEAFGRAAAASRRRRPGAAARIVPSGRPGTNACGAGIHPDIGRLEKIATELFRRCRPLRALAGPRDRKKTTRDEERVPGDRSGGRGP
eukprot:370559-Pyramimonas_sp.AAC.1